MSNQYSIIESNGITEIKFHINPSIELVKSIIDDVAENYPYERRLWDLSEIDFDLSENELINLCEYGKKTFIKPNKLALFAVKDLGYGEMRQFAAYREEDGNAIPRVFRNKQEAIDWLNS